MASLGDNVKGMTKGLGVTFKTMLKPAVTVAYPHD